MQRANRWGRIQTISRKRSHESGRTRIGAQTTEGDSLVLLEDNLSIVDWNNFNTEGKEIHYIQTIHIVGQLSSNKQITDDTMKQAEFDLVLQPGTAKDPEFTRARASKRRETETTPDGYRQAFDKLSIRL